MIDVKEMSREELEQFADRMRIDRNSFLLDNKPSTKLTLEIGMLERQLKDAWERNYSRAFQSSHHFHQQPSISPSSFCV